METDAEATATLGEDRSEWPEVAIIVLNWNNYEDTAECLSSLSDLNYPNYQVNLVDNGSTDGSIERLETEFEWCEIIKNRSNVGFAAGVNVGIRRALDSGSDYVLLVNNDMVLDSKTLASLIRTSESHDRVGITTGIIKKMSSGEVSYAGGKLNILTLSPSKISELQADSNPYETEYVTGALMLLSANFLETEGLFDEQFFFGMDDADLSWRAHCNGWKLLVDPDVSATHRVSSTAGGENAFCYYHSTRNRLYLASKSLSPIQQLVFISFFITSRIFRFVQWAARGELGLIIATLLGISDFTKGDFEKSRTELI